MGLLDDAIREHLELKRRRGGDPAEIERAEREALGPVRREPEPIQSADFGDAESAEHELVPAFEDDEPYDDLDDPYGELPAEPEAPLAHGAVGTGPSAPTAPESLEFAEEHDPWVSHPASEQLDEPLAPHEDLNPRGLDALPEPGGPDPVSPPPVAPPPPGVPPARPSVPDHVNQETAEYHLEGGHPGEEPEDVLEETPEFLQDAPEHDRLWFEQRPPRDFDFDN